MPIAFLKPTSESDTGANIATGVLTDVDEGVAAADAALETSVDKDWGGDTTTWGLENLPAAAVSINSYTLRVRAEIVGTWVDDTVSYGWTFNGTGITLGEITWLFETEGGDGLVDKTLAGTGTPTVANINAGNVRVIQAYSASMAKEAVALAWDCFELEVDYSEAGETIAVGQALETDTANAITVSVGNTNIAVGQSSETDLAQAVTVATAISVVVGQVSETDSAQAVTVSLGATPIATGQVVETDLSQAITSAPGNVDIPVGQAAETDTAQVVTPSQTTNVSVGQVTETDAAQAVAVVSSIAVTVGQSSETDTAQAVVVASPITVVVGQSLEADTAQPVTVVAGLVAINVGQALETDLAQTVTPLAGLVSITVGQALETDSAQAITVLGAISIVVGQALETDTAQTVAPVAGVVAISVGQAVETDLAQAVTVAAGLTWTQDQFRFGADDGNEASYSFIAAQNVNITQAANIATIIRIQGNTTGNQPTRQMKIQCKQTSEPDSTYLDLPVAV